MKPLNRHCPFSGCDGAAELKVEREMDIDELIYQIRCNECGCAADWYAGQLGEKSACEQWDKAHSDVERFRRLELNTNE